MTRGIPMKFLAKDVTYDNIKSHKNQGPTLSLEDTFFEPPQPPPSPLRVNLKKRYLTCL